MSNKALTLAALILASGTFAGAAEAGGVRLQFGGPLGSFTAHPHLSSGPGGTMRNQGYAHKPSHDAPRYAKPSYVGRMNHDDAPVKKVAKRPAPKVHVAEEKPAPRKVVKKAPKVEVAEEAPIVRKIKKPKIAAPVVTVAKAVETPVTTDGAPSIFVPDSPPVAAEGFTGTQSTPAAVRTAAVTAPATAEAGVSPRTRPKSWSCRWSKTSRRRRSLRRLKFPTRRRR